MNWQLRGLGIAADLAFLALSGRVITLLLLKQHFDAPLVVAAWLAAVWGLVAVCRPFARQVGRRSGLVLNLSARMDGVGFAFFAFFLALVFLFHFGYLRAQSDGRDYFVQVRSLVIDRDFDVSNDIAAFATRGSATFYPVGAAALWTPFYAGCHLWLGMLNAFGSTYSRTGYEAPYQMAIGLGTVVYGFMAFVLIYRVLREWFSIGLSISTAFVLCGGTFLLWYVTVESSMSHGASMFATTLFVYLWVRTRHARSVGQWATLGAAGGLMASVRWAEGLFIILPGIDALRDYREAARGRLAVSPRRLLAGHAAFVGMALLSFMPQFLFWRANRGAWLDAPLDRYRLAWFAPSIEAVLFSPNHGLFTWTPLVYLALLGLPLFMRKDGYVAAMLLLGFLTQVYINSLPRIWWGGSAFGARRFAGCAVVFAIGLAAMIDWLHRRPKIAVGTVVGSLVGINLFFMEDVRRGRLPVGEGVTLGQMLRATYARIGNPFSFPASAILAWRHGVSPAVYDRVGLRVYNSLFIDLGDESDDDLLTSGWSYRERDTRTSFRWAVTTESGFVVPLTRTIDYELRFRARPFQYPRSPVASVDVWVNDNHIADVELQPGWEAYALHIPGEALRLSLNDFRFRYRQARSPQSLGLSGDGRPLAVRFDYIQLTPRRADSGDP